MPPVRTSVTELKEQLLIEEVKNEVVKNVAGLKEEGVVMLSNDDKLNLSDGNEAKNKNGFERVEKEEKDDEVI